jgi:hypothetical protein
LGWVLVLGVGVVVVIGFWMVGSPGQARREKEDEKRAERLLETVRLVRRFYKETGALPERLEEISEKFPISREEFCDPATQGPFEYRPLTKDRFEICAVFHTDASGRRRKYFYYVPSEDLESRAVFSHKQGRQCFTFSAKSPGD